MSPMNFVLGKLPEYEENKDHKTNATNGSAEEMSRLTAKENRKQWEKEQSTVQIIQNINRNLPVRATEPI